jgi:putative spermidine/putrescine transport system permease protein
LTDAVHSERAPPLGARSIGLKERYGWPLLFLLPAFIVIGFFFFTMSIMARISIAPNLGPAQIGDGATLDNYVQFFGSTFYLGYLFRSLWIAAYCTAITAVLGYTIAYFIHRSGHTTRVVVGTLLIIQFFTAYVIRTYAVMLVIGKTGILNRSLIGVGLIDQPLSLLFTETGVAIGMVLVSLPFMVFPILASLQAMPPNVEMAAASLGASNTRIFWQVTIPLTMPGIAAGVVVVYLFELTSYIVPGILGGGYVDMIANLIYAKAMQSFDHPFAAAAAVVTLLISGTTIYLLQKFFRLATPRT